MSVPDFSKLFGSGAASTQNWEDSNYLTGWGYLGETPPPYQLFDALQKQNDTKLLWLFSKSKTWQPSTIYELGDVKYPAGDYKSWIILKCTKAGTSSAVEPDWGETANVEITDNTAKWKIVNITSTSSGVTLGTIMPFLATVVPDGWLALDTGALVSRTTYPDLWAWVQANAPLISETDWQTQAAAQTSVGDYSTGDGSTTFRLPKILDYVRGGSTADAGTWQEDIFELHSHYLLADQKTVTLDIGSGNQKYAAGSGYGVENAAATQATGGAETRPKTIKMLYCVKAFDSAVNQGTIDITALANEVAAKQTATKFIKISDSKTYNTAGGTFTSGAWRTRDINTIDTDETGLASVASNQITLPAGTYYVDITASAQACNAHKARLYNITTSATLLNGTTEYSSSSYAGKTNSIVNGKIVLAASSVLEVQHYCGTTGTYGTAANISGVNEVYTTAIFRKVG